MFEKKNFTSHAGKQLDWKIECDTLTDADLETLAYLVSKKFQFGNVAGVPNGGTKFAKALRQYCNTGPRLLVDDVFTTGESMYNYGQPGDIGVVIFSRGQCPSWITPIFQSNFE